MIQIFWEFRRWWIIQARNINWSVEKRQPYAYEFRVTGLVKKKLLRREGRFNRN